MFLYVIVGLAGYLIGSFPTGVVVSRQKYGLDVREMGSGNIGATNVTRVFGWYAGALVFLADFLKGFLPLKLLQRFFPDSPWLLTTAAAGLVLGHCFSAYLRFRGGKGVATSLGCITVVAPWVALVAAVIYIIVLSLTRISAAGSLGGMAVTLAYVVFWWPPSPVLALLVGISLVVLIRHHQNIHRLIGTWKARH